MNIITVTPIAEESIRTPKIHYINFQLFRCSGTVAYNLYTGDVKLRFYATADLSSKCLAVIAKYLFVLVLRKLSKLSTIQVHGA